VATDEINILVIAPVYNWFIKNLVETESKYIRKIDVFAHHNYLSEIPKYLPFGGYFEFIKQFSKEKMINVEGKPSNVNVHLLSMLYFIPDGKNKRLGDRIAKKFEKYIKKHNIEFDIIHAHFTYPQGYAAIELGRKFGVPVVVTLHENMPHLNSLLAKHKNGVYLVWRRADALIRVNKKDFPIYLNAGVHPSRLHHIPNGFNSRQFPVISKDVAKKHLDLDTKKRIILNVARLSEEKGQNYLIEAMKFVIKEKKDVLCLIGGTGPLAKQLQKQIKRLGLEKYVQLCGFIPNEKIAYYMNGADIFVLPSLSEGNPTVMFEALGIGLPFIGTKVGGIPEIIISENFGLLVEPQNPKDLAEKIIIALNKKWEQDLIRTYAQQFSWDNIARQTLNIYELVKNNYMSNF
jgi:teichuronic acid biosynthesis glycosyltransferase TuaC